MSTKISQLPAASSVQLSAVFPLVQNATTEKATIEQLAEAIGGGGGVGLSVIQTTSVAEGPYSVAHGLGSVPLAVVIQPTYNTSANGGQFWLYTQSVALGYDSTNVYLLASDIGISAQIVIFSNGI